MTIEQAIEIIRQEYLCVDRDCNIEKNCGKCDLAMPSKEPILEAYKMAIAALDQEPSRSENPNKWIPVSERLPEENGSYFVTVKRGYVTTAIWVGTAEFWSEVTAWMPLPEPYKSEIPTSCSTCILDNTDACTRGAGRAVDDEACEDYLASPTGAESEE